MASQFFWLAESHKATSYPGSFSFSSLVEKEREPGYEVGHKVVNYAYDVISSRDLGLLQHAFMRQGCRGEGDVTIPQRYDVIL